MSPRRSYTHSGPKHWTVSELGAFYTEHRTELLAHSFRILRDTARAEEVVQDALIKVMLAAPELNSKEHALGYMHRTIENLCVDIFRIEGRRPQLVVLDEASAELESTWVDKGDHAVALEAAEDSAIVRQALAMLSPAERAALVMWEVEGRSTKDIAIELGIKESAVRHTVGRARASLRRILSEQVIDKDRGLTAIDLLSNSYRRASNVAKQSGKAVLSLAIFLIGYSLISPLSFDSGTLKTSSQEVVGSSPIVESTNDDDLSSIAVDEVTSPKLNSGKSSTAQPKKKSSAMAFPGLAENGAPSGFIVADSNGSLGSLYVAPQKSVMTEAELVISQLVKTSSGSANILLNQEVVSSNSGINYLPLVSYGKEGNWSPLVTSVTSLETKRLTDGNYLIKAVIEVESEVETSLVIPATASGRDLQKAPRRIVTHFVLNPEKTEILSQAVYVFEEIGKI